MASPGADCGNNNPDNPPGHFTGVHDSIMYRKGQPAPDGSWSFGEERLAVPHGGADDHGRPLPPSGCENVPRPGGVCVWDKEHACDPDVVAAAGWPAVGFRLDNVSYQFALFYLGIHQAAVLGPGLPFHPVEANHIGMAVSHSLEGPWRKRPGAIVIGDGWWGVGQASAIALNGTEVLLTYTRGDTTAFGQRRLLLDLADVMHPTVLAPERTITDAGLLYANGSTGSGGFVDAAMLYDPELKRFWTLRDGMPYPPPPLPPGSPDWCPVASSVQLAWIPEAAILGDSWEAQSFQWVVEVQRLSLPANASNRTHNPGFVSSALGHRLDPARIEAVVTSAGDLGQQCVWSYRPWSVTFASTGPSTVRDASKTNHS